jgi:hypothetical protein
MINNHEQVEKKLVLSRGKKRILGSTRIHQGPLHCKKRGVLPNPQNRFRRFLKASKEAQSLKKRIKKIYETFKGSSCVSRGRTFSYELLGFSTKP